MKESLPTKEGIMENPFRIQPGEHLYLENVFDRFLDWSFWNDEQDRSNRKPDCNIQLWYSRLCCPDHMAEAAEWDAFFRAFLALTIGDRDLLKHSFSIKSMKRFIAQNRLPTDPAKLAKYCGISVDVWNSIKVDVN